MLGAGQRGEARAEARATLKYLIIGSNGPEGLNVTSTARSARCCKSVHIDVRGNFTFMKTQRYLRNIGR